MFPMSVTAAVSKRLIERHGGRAAIWALPAALGAVP